MFQNFRVWTFVEVQRYRLDRVYRILGLEGLSPQSFSVIAQGTGIW